MREGRNITIPRLPEPSNGILWRSETPTVLYERLHFSVFINTTILLPPLYSTFPPFLKRFYHNNDNVL